MKSGLKESGITFAGTDLERSSECRDEKRTESEAFVSSGGQVMSR